MSGGGSEAHHVQVSGAEDDAALRALLAEAVRATLHAEDVSEGEISLSLLGDMGMRELNRRYLDRDRTTDVIAFSLGDEDDAPVGDVYVGVEQARRQAADCGSPWESRLLLKCTLKSTSAAEPAP